MKHLIIASTSTIHGGEYLEYLLPELEVFFRNVKTVLFIPYARPGGISHEDYTGKVREAFAKINIAVIGIHECENPADALKSAQGIFTGGGNTFLLVYQLYKNELMSLLRDVIRNGTPYLGTSAGSNICGLTI
ncbi:MAG TPA: Type 1 glutamine amidotransferase-like domain-containing protein, partial [Flavobacterium sp.]|nr:Type 1 glutamine amidotransferase-like domain-containing protein [Flavobacterium sp.]